MFSGLENDGGIYLYGIVDYAGIGEGEVGARKAGGGEGVII